MLLGELTNQEIWKYCSKSSTDKSGKIFGPKINPIQKVLYLIMQRDSSRKYNLYMSW
jgi:hypothetical protein